MKENCFFRSSKNLLPAVLVLAMVLQPWRLSANPLNDLTIYTENFAPLSFENGGRAQGIAVDLLLQILNRVGSPTTVENFKLVPWARGYKYVQYQKNTLLFSIMRTPKREHLFKWVGPIMPSDVVLLAKKKTGIKITPSTDLNRFYYGVINNDVGELFLLGRGVEPSKMNVTDSAETAARMLHSERFDMWAYGKTAAFWKLRTLGFNETDFEVVEILRSGEAYFALNKDTDDAVVSKLQKALEEIRAEGGVTAVIKSYIPGHR